MNKFKLIALGVFLLIVTAGVCFGVHKINRLQK